MRRAEFRLVTVLAIALFSLFTLEQPAEAQTGARINFSINPTIFRAGQPASAELSVFSVSTTPITLSAGTNFMFFVDPSLGTVQSAMPPVAVESSSVAPGDFSASFAGGQNPVIVTYNGPPKTFAFGDSFSVKISLLASAQAGPGKLGLSSQLLTSVNGALPFTTASIVDFANSGTSAITHDQTLIGDGTSAMPLGIAPGGVTTADLANGAVTAPKIAAGQVVKSLNGLFDNISLSPGANIALTPSGNTLTISAPGSLTAVAHDSTLTGNGTGSSPLSVAGASSNPVQSFVSTSKDIALGNSDTAVVSVTVPAGAYVINAKVDVINNDNDVQNAVCSLSTGDTTTLRLAGKGGLTPVIAWQAELTLLDTATFNDLTPVIVTCSGFNFFSLKSIIVATKVSSIQ